MINGFALEIKMMTFKKACLKLTSYDSVQLTLGVIPSSPKI